MTIASVASGLLVTEAFLSWKTLTRFLNNWNTCSFPVSLCPKFYG